MRYKPSPLNYPSWIKEGVEGSEIIYLDFSFLTKDPKKIDPSSFYPVIYYFSKNSFSFIYQFQKIYLF